MPTSDTGTDTWAQNPALAPWRTATAACGAATPALVGGGWGPGASAWMCLAVPARRHDCGGLVVDLCTIPEPDPNEGHQQ